MKIFRTGYDGTTFVSQREKPPEHKTVLTVCRYVTGGAVCIAAIIAAGIWAVLIIGGIAFIWMLIREGA